ncbi:hypothetical protein ATO12_15970 [Aquimarina atlantica]|uniref:Uncharacterized protein n=1 Tax=Aquimarina atlantica TaxID=1317122 RepID=A0A023BTV8_9FLAO|nr:hypothetical protein [Aquimarina atlantica]EZH73436.1 hypothetical protein ATO12_15970 [Aquimarina atlantica]
MSSRDRYTEIINGMKSDDKQLQWHTMVKWCTLWIDVEKKELKPLLELIKECKEVGFWECYYPSQSHYALGLSLGKNYDERYNLPMVYIRYNADKNNFDVQYQKGQGGETTRVDCGSKLSENHFKSITHWLGDKKNNSRDPENE